MPLIEFRRNLPNKWKSAIIVIMMGGGNLFLLLLVLRLLCIPDIRLDLLKVSCDFGPIITEKVWIGGMLQVDGKDVWNIQWIGRMEPIHQGGLEWMERGGSLLISFHSITIIILVVVMIIIKVIDIIHKVTPGHVGI